MSYVFSICTCCCATNEILSPKIDFKKSRELFNEHTAALHTIYGYIDISDNDDDGDDMTLPTSTLLWLINEIFEEYQDNTDISTNPDVFVAYCICELLNPAENIYWKYIYGVPILPPSNIDYGADGQIKTQK